MARENLIGSSRFQEVIEAVEALPLDDQALLIEIIRYRLIQHRRKKLAAEIARPVKPTGGAKYTGGQ